MAPSFGDVTEAIVESTSASVSTDIVQTIADKTWTFLDGVQAASLQFCAGLLEAMNDPSPASLDFFRSLPSDTYHRWAVCAPATLPTGQTYVE
ncbi:hypothetical protein VE03_00590 [Pseudogymnoascus sp. 23342-1-I1]|nr:hypothetical protein VE03_00590 [Pseudogymnoascus sp. 23342-1-I1]